MALSQECSHNENHYSVEINERHNIIHVVTNLCVWKFCNIDRYSYELLLRGKREGNGDRLKRGLTFENTLFMILK